EIESRGLGHLLDPNDYGGCFVPRFIEHNPQSPLSMHAFGLAFDVNVTTNAVGTRGEIHPKIVRTFERWGFSWGGRWSPPDPMHFELTSLLRS
ncbi:MAG: M15 family metallopeptidase, partial [Actinomycetota bacterium]